MISFTPSNTLVEAGQVPGFCGDCQTYAYAIAPCGATFTNTDIEINGTYVPPQSAAKCICTDVLQKVLWNCARCELLAGFGSHSQPPQAYQTQCIGWGIPVSDMKAPYTGTVAPGTTTPLTGGTTGSTTTGSSPAAGTGGASGTNPTGGSGASSSGGPLPSPSDSSNNAVSGGAEGSSGPNGTAIGISVGIIGVAIVAGSLAVFVMKRNRRRHEPLELDGTYVGLDDQWEKPGRSHSPAMMPAPIASAAPLASRGPMQQHGNHPFESRPGGGGGSVVGGYDGQYEYDQYHQGGGGGGYNAYNQPGYQGYAAHDYGYEHAMPTSGPYHGGKSTEGGPYM
ncbi:hypothetical protein BGZ98_001965 [Dissophora globulifera]|nr:hypothetical protein BGZ98_001965 [Dissophora globulifera]